LLFGAAARFARLRCNWLFLAEDRNTSAQRERIFGG